MKKWVSALFLLYLFVSAKAQNEQQIYEQAFQDINCMLRETCSPNFKTAVFIVENAYFSNGLNKGAFEGKISFLTQIIRQYIKKRALVYAFPDKEEVEKCAAIFSVMTDTIPIFIDSGTIAYRLPYTYDFKDIWGHKNWNNMFVSKLLDTRKGNCHSMPFLYKILADEIGAKTSIAVAPNHFYIKHKNKAEGWYNTELTSGVFPMDAWLMASGYIHLDAIVNKLYMEALNEKQMLALCLVDLAQGYERKLGPHADNGFILACCDTALHYYPNYINALLLKAETKKKNFEYIMNQHQARYPSDIPEKTEAQISWSEINTLYTHIHNLGYRRMPEDMYLNWLLSLKEQREKYENKKIATFTDKPSH